VWFDRAALGWRACAGGALIEPAGISVWPSKGSAEDAAVAWLRANPEARP
jgi:hypothetical protein